MKKILLIAVLTSGLSLNYSSNLNAAGNAVKVLKDLTSSVGRGLQKLGSATGRSVGHTAAQAATSIKDSFTSVGGLVGSLANQAINKLSSGDLLKAGDFALRALAQGVDILSIEQLEILEQIVKLSSIASSEKIVNVIRATKIIKAAQKALDLNNKNNTLPANSTNVDEATNNVDSSDQTLLTAEESNVQTA